MPVPYADLGDPQSLNLYGYVRGLPTTRVDADGHWPQLLSPQAVEEIAHLVEQGTKEGAKMIAESAVTGTRVVTNTVGVVVFVVFASQKTAPPDKDEMHPHTATGGNGARNGGTKGTTTSPGPDGMKNGSSNPDGAGKPFNQTTKDGARAESGNKCVFCGNDTTREPGPDQSNIDHADARSRGGDNSSANAQNTCRTCNQDKGTRSTDEYLKHRQDNPQKYNHEPH